MTRPHGVARERGWALGGPGADPRTGPRRRWQIAVPSARKLRTNIHDTAPRGGSLVGTPAKPMAIAT